MNLNLNKRFGRYNTLLTGIVAGIILPVVIYFMIYFTSVRDIGSAIFSNLKVAANIIPILISHCILPNLLFFMVLTGINWMQAAKGILGSTVVLTIILFAVKLILQII
ncbi:MAG: hypothetical protein JXB19_06385 [Bacteroidales bacterium]|nr:hypothetical protein [Bacteroidales bacterium]